MDIEGFLDMLEHDRLRLTVDLERGKIIWAAFSRVFRDSRFLSISERNLASLLS